MADYLDRIRDAYRNGLFQQLHLLTASSFLSYAQDRSIRVDPMALDSFRDIIPSIGPSGQNEAFYHPYQIWVLDKLHRVFEPQIQWDTWARASESKILELITRLRQFAQIDLAKLKESVDSFYKVLALISLCEPAYLPAIRRVLSTREGNFADYIRWRQSFSIHDALSRCDLSADDVSIWRERFEWDGQWIDPAEAWRSLIIRADYRSRDRLRKNLRLAHDYYEMAEILKYVVEEATGTRLPSDDDWYLHRVSRGVRAVINRAAPVTERTVLKRIVRSFDLDPSYKGYWFVEGDTEVGFFSEFASAAGIDLEERGIALVNLGGGGDIAQIRRTALVRLRSKSFTQILERFRQDEVFTLFTLDDEPGIRGGIEKLRRLDLITAGFFLWPEDFESANFEVVELVHVIGQVMSFSMDDARAEILATDVQLEMAKTSSSGRRRALPQVLVRVARRTSGFEGFSRSENWGRALARFASDHPQRNGVDRHVLRAFQYAISMSWANFAATVENMVCGPSGEMIPRQPTP